MRALHEQYKDRLDICFMDPRNILALWDNIRYGIRPSRPTWVLDRKKVFEGIPSLTDLKYLIDTKLSEQHSRR